jgi:hypothetical protein
MLDSLALRSWARHRISMSHHRGMRSGCFEDGWKTAGSDLGLCTHQPNVMFPELQMRIGDRRA